MLQRILVCTVNNVFGQACGEFTPAKDRCEITKKVEKQYLQHFGVEIGDQDKPWAAHVICEGCQDKFRRWESDALSSFKFGVPMLQREPTNCINNCYFCMVKTVGFLIKYQNIPSVIRPLTHSSEVPTPSIRILECGI